jgi:primase-polymerase (primpol)-like protein
LYKETDTDQELESTHLSVEYLKEKETELIQKLQDKQFLSRNLIFSTHKTDEYTFHGCMKDYNGQNFGLLKYPAMK